MTRDASSNVEPTLCHGDLLTEQQLDDAVHQLVLQAQRLGMIPIAGIISERQPDARHKVLGFGWNHLREGIPGIHGETGAIINMGRRPEGYADLTATSSLSPCPFCQGCLAQHLGIRQIRILDATNYRPDFTGYQRVGLTPKVAEHSGIVQTFSEWVNDPANARIWSRDIGEWAGAVWPVFEVQRFEGRTQMLMELAIHKARQAEQSGEAPIGAVIIDAFGEVIGAGHSMIIQRNDPTLVAAMSAWRACGAREHWRDKTLFLTAGPDHIAYSMFHVFRFGQLVVGSDRAFAGRISDVRSLDVPVHTLNHGECETILRRWITSEPPQRVREYLGADFAG